MPSTEQMEQMVANGQMTPEQLQMAKEYMPQGGFEAYGATEGQFEQYATEYQGMNPQEAFEQWAATEGQNFSPEQVEQFREMAEQYRPENQNYDNLQQQQFDITQPQPAEVRLPDRVHVADHNGDGDTTDPVDTHPHEIYRHTQGTGDLTDDTCHDHATGATVGC